MVTSNVFILWTMMCYKNVKIILICFAMLLLSDCRRAFVPFTTNLKVPDGPPEFQAGWRDGCSSGFSTGNFVAGRFQDYTIGDGSLQHDPTYHNAFVAGWFSCYTSSRGFTDFPGGLDTAPFQ